MKLTKLFVGAFALFAMLVACDSDSASAKDTEIEELSSSSAVEIASSSSTIRNDSSSSSVMETSSSSETTQSSSSSENISAGSVYDATAKTLKDLRDGQTYKTVTIGTQTWMADNLNYETENSYCYDDDPSNCSKYGRLYTWAAAKTVCPSGWHLPSTTEFKTLFMAVGGKSTAATALKSTSGWNEYEGESGNGTDAFGFSALPAGNRHNYGNYNYEGNYAYFWSSTEINSYYAYSMYLEYDDDYASLDSHNKGDGFSVRCVKD